MSDDTIRVDTLEKIGNLSIWHGAWAKHVPEKGGRPLCIISDMYDDGNEVGDELTQGETLRDAIDNYNAGIRQGSAEGAAEGAAACPQCAELRRLADDALATLRITKEKYGIGNRHVMREKNQEIEKLREALWDATELFGEIMRDEVNHQDEAEKWLRAYGNVALPAEREDLVIPPGERGPLEEHVRAVHMTVYAQQEPDGTWYARVPALRENTVSAPTREAAIEKACDDASART